MGDELVLWTIQSEEVHDLIQSTGVYHCDFGKTVMSDCQE